MNILLPILLALAALAPRAQAAPNPAALRTQNRQQPRHAIQIAAPPAAENPAPYAVSSESGLAEKGILFGMLFGIAGFGLLLRPSGARWGRILSRAGAALMVVSTVVTMVNALR